MKLRRRTNLIHLKIDRAQHNNEAHYADAFIPPSMPPPHYVFVKTTVMPCYSRLLHAPVFCVCVYLCVLVCVYIRDP